MRLSWPFRRSPGPSGPATGAASHAAPAPRGGWRELPPLRASVDRPALTSDARAFDDARAGSHPLLPVLSDITTATVMEPIVTAQGRPRPATVPRAWVAGAAELPLGHPIHGQVTQRSSDMDLPSEDPSLAAEASAGHVETAPTGDAAPAASHAGSTRALTGTAGAQRATGPTVGPTMSGPTTRVDQAPSATTGRPTLARVTAPGARSMTLLAPTQREAIAGAAPSPGRLVLARPPGSAPSSSDAAVDAVGATASAGRDIGAGTTMAQPGNEQAAGPSEPVARPARPRRTGLGPPLELAHSVTRIDAGDRDADGASEAASVAASTWAARPAVPSSVAGGFSAGVSSSPRSGFVHPGTDGPASPPGPGGPITSPATLMPPIVARRSTRRWQRSALSPSEASEQAGQRAPQAGSPVASAASDGAGNDGHVRIDRSDAGAAAAAELHANAFTTGDTIVLPAGHGPLDSGRGRSLLAHELVHVGQQRRLGAALPHESTAAGRQLEQEARSAERLVDTLAPPRPRRPGLPLAHAPVNPSSGGHALATAGLGDDVGRAVSSAAAMGAPEGPLPGADAAAAADSASLRIETDGNAPAPQRADASAPAPVPGGSVGGPRTADEAELDDLARKLYERIRHRLGRELLLDRERSGLLTGSR